MVAETEIVRRWIAIVIADDEQVAGVQVKAADMTIGPN